MTNELQYLLDKAIELEDSGNTNDAIKIYNEIISFDTDWATPHYNLGLIYKYQCNWELSYLHNKRATEIDGNNEAAWWNLGIASTALNRWRIARTAWNKFGLNMEINDDEPNLDLETTPVRLNPNENGEVVWCKRIDPARAIIRNIPLPDTNHRFNDIILNDGAPQGYRTNNGKEYAVFNELQLISKSDCSTYSCIIYTNNDEHIEKLENICKKTNVEIEDWSTVIYLCKQCSEGKVHEHHDNELNKVDSNERKIGFAAANYAEIASALYEWQLVTLCDHSNVILELE